MEKGVTRIWKQGKILEEPLSISLSPPLFISLLLLKLFLFLF